MSESAFYKGIIITASFMLFNQINDLRAQATWIKLPASNLPAITQQIPGKYLGAAWVDLDNDGDIDLFVAPNKLYKNIGAAQFVAMDTLPFTPLKNYGSSFVGGSSWADLNNDGFIDAVIASEPAGVFKNNGNGTFTNISNTLPGLNNYPAWGAAIGNWNMDAFLDFIFVHAAGFHSSSMQSSKLYLNNNNSITPQLKTGYQITDSLRPFTVPYWSDYDLDGDMDLFVASGPGGTAGYDFCYKNIKKETGKDSLIRMTSELFATQKQDGQCYNFVDFDNDADLDLCLTNYGGMVSKLYKNNNGIYIQINSPWLFALPLLSNCWGDYDNDGDLDFITSGDGSMLTYYINDGLGNFNPKPSVINLTNGASGVINGDIDNDGDLDLFASGKNNWRHLYLNDTLAQGNNWINIKLVGTASNKSAIGSIVKIKSLINGSPKWQMREVNAQNSFQGMNDLRVHFGLNTSTIIDSIQIRWPSGIIEVYKNLTVNSFYSITESGVLSDIKTISTAKDDNMVDCITLSPNPIGSFVKISVNEMTNQVVYLELYDNQGRRIKQETFVSSTELSLENFSPGVYYVKTLIGKKLCVKKIIRL